MPYFRQNKLPEGCFNPRAVLDNYLPLKRLDVIQAIFGFLKITLTACHFFLLLRYKRYLEVEFVVNGFVAEVIEERTRTEFYIVFRTVNGDFASSVDCAVAFIHSGQELHFVGFFLDGQVTHDFVVAFCVLRDRLGDHKLRSWVFRRSEKVIAFEVTNQFAGILAFEVSAGDGVHVNIEGTTGEFAIGPSKVATLHFNIAGVFAGHFVASPGDGAGSDIYIVVSGVLSSHYQKSQQREEKQFFHFFKEIKMVNESETEILKPAQRYVS